MKDYHLKPGESLPLLSRNQMRKAYFRIKLLL